MVVTQSEQCLEHNLYDIWSSLAKMIHWYSCMNNRALFYIMPLFFTMTVLINLAIRQIFSLSQTTHKLLTDLVYWWILPLLNVG